MPLSDSIIALTRHLTYKVWVNRVLLRPGDPVESTGTPGVMSIKVSKSYESPVPIARIGVNRVPDWVQPGQPVEIWLGYDQQTIPVFVGYVQSRDRSTRNNAILAAGKLFNVFRKSEIASRDVDGVLLNIAIRDLLFASGIGYEFQFINIPTPAYTIGSDPGVNATLERMTVSQMLQKLMDLEGLRITEWGNGRVRVEVVDLIPAPTPFKTYDTTNSDTPHILEGRTEEDPSAIKTRVLVTGATIVSGTSPNETSLVIQSAPAQISDFSLVQPPLGAGEHIEVEYSNHLIDTVEKANEVAARLMTELGRVPRTNTIKMPGDPELELGMTIRFDFPEIDLEGDFIIASVQHEVTMRGYNTIVGLIGGPGAGVSIDLLPTANFSVRIDREVFGTKIYAFVTFDASPSHPENNIASYAWSDNQASIVTPAFSSLTSKIITVRLDPADISGDGWDVTLSVTDRDGLVSDAYKKEGIDVGASVSDVEIPAIFVAADIAMASPDGGQNWNDVPFVSEFTAVAAHRPDGVHTGYACFGTVDGRIHRTIDFLTSVPAQAWGTVGAQVEDIAWDWRDPRNVWAVTTTGKVYRSIDRGASFQLYEDLRVKLNNSLLTTYHIGLPGAGGIWIYGGTGGGAPLIAVNPDIGVHIWTQVQMLSGELWADLSGPAGVHIVDAQDNGRGAGLVIILADAGNDVYGIYQCPNPTIANPAWKRPSGISSSLTEGRYVVGDFGTTIEGLSAQFHAAFDNRDIYHSANGINWIKSADVMPAGVTPNHAIWSVDEIFASLFPSVHMIAAEDAGGDQGVFKSADGMQTVGKIRPATGFPSWPTGNPAHQVAFGPSPGAPGRVVIVSEQPSDSSRWVSRKLHNPNWQHEDIPTLLSSSVYNRLRVLTSAVWFVFGFDARTDYASVVPMRTADGGSTFAQMANPSGTYKFIDVARAADGRLWGLAIDTGSPTNVRVYYSESSDGGADATWTQSTGFPQAQGTHGICTIVCHPTNQYRIHVMGHKNTNDFITISTVSPTPSWNVRTHLGIASDRGVEADFRVVAAGSDNRLIGLIGTSAVASPSSTMSIWTSDDLGGTWTRRWVPSSLNAANFLVGPVGNALNTILYVAFFDESARRTRIVRSTTGGNDWSQFVSSVSGFDSLEQPRGGIGFDWRENALYIKFSGGHTTEAMYVYRMAPILSNGSWVDYTDDIFPTGVTSLANTGVCQSIGIVP